MLRAVVITVLVLVGTGQIKKAQAFRCTQASGDDSVSSDGPSLSWRTRELTFTLQPLGSKQMPRDKTLDVLRAAFGVWQNMTLADSARAQCGSAMGATDITFTEVPGQNDVAWVGYNFVAPQTNMNLLVFRDDTWPPPDPTSTDIIALSTITYSALSGEIIDADIEFNSANFSFSADDPNGEQMDLLSTAVHEIGHFLGLAHCADSSSCGNHEVMEATANLGEYDKRQLQCDDRAGLLFKYPKGAANGYASKVASLTDKSQGLGTCLPPQTSTQMPSVRQLSRSQGRLGCQQVASGTADLTLAWPLTAALLVWRRRRRLTGAALACVALCSCSGQDMCGGAAVPIDVQAPLILSMDYVGQVDIDPWHVVLTCDVVDNDGDLGNGTVDYYVNGSKESAETQRLERVFSASGGVPQDSTDATLQLLLRFSRSTASNAYLHLGTQLTDAAGHKSNCFNLDLSYLLISMLGA
jgi:hypothetical protein